MKAKTVVLAAALCALVTAQAVNAQHTAKGGPESGQKVAADPQSGKLREPSRDEMELLASLERALARPTDLTPVIHDNGMKSVDLQGAFMEVAIARVDEHGTLAGACVSTIDEARRFLLGPVTAPAPKPAPVLEEK
jgi:hypothetical protein